MLIPYDDSDHQPGHAKPSDLNVSFVAYGTQGEYTLAQFHGTERQIIQALALFGSRWGFVGALECELCQPKFGCFHIEVLVDAHLTQTDVQAALLTLSPGTTLPYVARRRRI